MVAAIWPVFACGALARARPGFLQNGSRTGHANPCGTGHGGRVVKYRTIVADPPWPFQWNGGKGGRRRRETELGYRTRTIDEIAAMPVGDLAHPDGAFLFLWATDEVYAEGQALQVARAWGFERCGPALIWRKPNYGMGVFPRAGHEPLLVCRRGCVSWKQVPETVGTHSVQTWNQPRGKANGGKQHSRKPEGALRPD